MHYLVRQTTKQIIRGLEKAVKKKEENLRQKRKNKFNDESKAMVFAVFFREKYLKDLCYFFCYVFLKMG